MCCSGAPAGSLGSSSRARVPAPGGMRRYALRPLARRAGCCGSCFFPPCATGTKAEGRDVKGGTHKVGSAAALDVGARSITLRGLCRRKKTSQQPAAVFGCQGAWGRAPRPARHAAGILGFRWEDELPATWCPQHIARSKRPLDLPRSVATSAGYGAARPMSKPCLAAQRKAGAVQPRSVLLSEAALTGPPTAAQTGVPWRSLVREPL